MMLIALDDDALDDDALDGDDAQDTGGGGRSGGEGCSCKQSEAPGDFHKRCHRDNKVSGDYDDDDFTKKGHVSLPVLLKFDKSLSSSSRVSYIYFSLSHSVSF